MTETNTNGARILRDHIRLLQKALREKQDEKAAILADIERFGDAKENGR